MTFHNRVRVSTSTTGTGTISLGSATAGYGSFADGGVANGATVTYCLEDGNNFEVGRGVYDSGALTLTRAQVLLSKIAGNAADTTLLTLSGSATVFLTAAAEDLAALQPLDADLTAIAALTTTAFGRSLLTQADETATRATLDLATSTTDNAVSRYDGILGATQNSGVIIDDSNNMLFPTGTAISWNSGDVSITHSANALAFAGATNGYSFDNPLNISPPAATTARGINISQTGPTSGTDAQSVIYFNRISIDAAGTHATSEGDIIGLGVSMGLGGSNAAGQHIALFGQTVVNAATSDTPQPFLKVYCGVTGIAQGSVNDGGTSTANSTDAKGYTLGMNAFSILAAGATNYLHATAIEMLTTVRTGASVRTHCGARIAQYFDHAESGANLDCGLQFINQTGAVGWAHYGIIFDGTSDDAGTMFKSTATAIGITGTPTLTHGIDFATAAFTGAAFRSFQFFVNGSGDISGNSLAVTGTGSPPTIGIASPTADTLSFYTRDLESLRLTSDAGANRYLIVNASNNGNPEISVSTGAGGVMSVNGNILVVNTTRIASGTAIPAGGTAGIGYKFSSASNFGIFFGSGAPTLAAARGSLYLRSDGSADSLLYTNSDGGTTWIAVDNV